MTSRRAALPRVNPSTLVRPRLLEKLDRWSPMTLLVAPAGAGKAVLAGHWATRAVEAGEEVLWFDGEVDSAEDVVAVLAGLVDEPLRDDLSSTLRRLRRSLHQLQDRVAVVVDNAESVVAAVGTGLVEIVRDVGHVHLVLSLQHRPPVLTRAVTLVETSVVGPEDLQFRAVEVVELARLHGIPCDEDEGARIAESVGGWPSLVSAGFAGAVVAGHNGDASWSARQVAIYLGAALEHRLSDDAWRAALRAGLVLHPTYDAVLSATGPLAQGARRELEAIGVLDPSMNRDQPTVRLPPLLRELLRDRHAEIAPGAAGEVHASVVAHWLAQRRPDRAVAQAVEGQAWAVAATVLEDRWWSLLMDDPAGLVHALAVMPGAAVSGHPRTEVLRQVFLPHGSQRESDATRARIRELLDEDPGDLAARAARPAPAVAVDLDLLALLGLRARVRGDLDAVLELAERTEAMLLAVPGGAHGVPGAQGRRAALQAGTGWMLLGRTTRAWSILQRAATTLGEQDQVTADAAGKLALLAGLHGDRDASLGWHERWLTSKPPSTRFGLFIDIAAITAEALEAVESLRPQAARAALARLRPDGARAELWPFAMVVETQLALAWGGALALRSELATARADATGQRRLPLAVMMLACCEADLTLSLGRTGTAERILAELDPAMPLVAVSRARLACVSGRFDDALALVSPVVLSHHPFVPLRVEGHLVAAWCHDQQGRPDDAVASLRAAVDTARRDGLVLPFSHVPVDLLQRHGEGLPVLADLLAMLDEAGVQSAFSLAEDGPQLTPREEAVLGCLARGLSLEESARELFVSRNTVKSQATSIYRKLGAGDRREAVRRAYELGLLD